MGNTHGYAFCPWETTDESCDTSTLVATQRGAPLSRGMPLEASKVRKRYGIFTNEVSQVHTGAKPNFLFRKHEEFDF